MSEKTLTRIAADFAAIPFENHEAKLLAVGYLKQRLALENLIAAIGAVEAGGSPVTRLREAMQEARDALAALDAAGGAER